MILFPGSSLRFRLLFLVFLAVMPLFGFTLYTASTEREIEIEHAQQDALKLARFVSMDQRREIEAARQLLSVLTVAPEIAGKNIQACNILFADLKRRFHSYANLLLIDPDGNILSSAVPHLACLNVADRPWFRELVHPDGTSTGEFITRCADREPAILFGVPVFDQENHPKAFLGVSLDLHRWLDQNIVKGHMPIHTTLLLIANDGTVLARYPEPESWVGKSLPQSPLLTLLHEKEEGTVRTSKVDGVQRLYGFSRLSNGTVAAVGVSEEVALVHAKWNLLRNLLFLAFVTGLVLITTLIGADLLILRRVASLINATQRLAEGDLSARSGQPHERNELGRLARTFDDMASALEKRQFEAEQLEETLRDSGRRFRAIFNQAFQFTVVMDPDGRLLEANESALDFIGQKNADIFGRPLWQMDWWSHAPEAQQRIREALDLASRGIPTRLEVETRGSGGRTALMDFSFKPVRNGSGRVSQLIGEGRDITERKKAENALQESEARYRAIVEDQTELISRFSPDHTLTFANEAYCRYFNESREELLGRSFWHHVAEEERQELDRYLGSLSPKNPVATIEHRVVTPGSELQWLQWTDRAIFDDRGEVIEIQAVGRDITDRKKAEQTLRQSEQALRVLSSQLLTAQEDERKRIARELHDSIGQSLSAIKFGVQNALSRMAESGTTEERQALQPLVTIVQHAIDEVRKIMTDLRPSMLDDLGILATIGWFCRDYQSVYSNITLEKEIEIQESEIPERLKIVIFRILQEALNNIAKHSRANFVTLSLRKREGVIELVIEDDGIGFDRSCILSRESCKNGFGLSSMRERAEFSGGSFTIESASGEGTIIRTSWPLQKSSEQ